MGTRELYNYKLQKWVPYVSYPDKWYQHLIDLSDRLVQPDHLGRFIVGSGAKYRHLKEMETEQIEKQRPVVNLVSSVAQATDMARSEIKREREMAKRPLYLRDDVKTSHVYRENRNKTL